MPEANVLYAVTALVVAGLVAWVAFVLKTAKEPWARELPREVVDAGAGPSSREEALPPSSSLPKVLSGTAKEGADTTAEATAVVVAKKKGADEKKLADEDKAAEEKAAEKHASERSAVEKAPVEKAEKAPVEKAEKAPVEKAPDEKAPDEKAPDEKAPDEKKAGDKKSDDEKAADG